MVHSFPGYSKVNMRRLLPTLLLLLITSDFTFGFLNVYPKLKSYPVKDGEDVGEALFLTPLIESGKIDAARNLSLVQHKETDSHGVSSYSGY